MDEASIRARVATLSLEQKASLTSGSDVWHTEGIDAAGILSVMVTDGPHGLRKQTDESDGLGLGSSTPATCFPPAVALGSSWNVDLLERVGRAVAAEALAENVAVVLGPGINIKRSPLGGRNFEYLSEDPHVAGVLGAALIRGTQSLGVGTSLKHFAANNQETDRFRVSAEIDARTLRELYLAGFEYAVKQARPWTVMCSYNKVNGVWSSQNRWLLSTVLRDEWGFDGLVMSDWGAVNDRVSALGAGLDLEMPPTGTDGLIVDAVRSGELSEAVLDTAATRLLVLLDRTSATREPGAAFDPDEHHAVAHAAALEGAVLLKNDGDLLPLAVDSDQRIAVIGELARSPRYQGAGSSQVNPTRLDNALDAMRAIAGERVRFAPDLDEAVAVARDSDVVVVFLGLPASAESEGFDRTDMDLPADQLAVLDAVAAVCDHVVVVLSNGSVVSVADWQHRVDAVLEGWLLGQAGGTALADLLFGRANPSGRLAESIPLRLEDNPSYLHFPGGDGVVAYGEGLYVGYRYYDTLDRPVAYPFGHGLSYTSFEYADLFVTGGTAAPVTVQVTVRNTGAATGAEVVQVYVRDVESALDRPAHELKAFTKVHLEPGAEQTVSLELDERAFSYWSPRDGRWRLEGGAFEIQVGASSRDLRLRHTVQLDGDGWFAPLTAMSTVSEWLAHPVGSEVLLAAVAEMGGAGEELLADPMLAAMLDSLPLQKAVTFGAGVSQEQVDLLVAAVEARRVSPQRPAGR